MTADDPKLTKAQRRAAARAKAQALRQEQERKAKRAKIARRSLLGVGVVAVIGVGAGIAVHENKKDAAASSVSLPKAVEADGSWTYGKALTPGSTTEGASVLDVFFDYSCHYCAAFDSTHADEIASLLQDGKITLALHPAKILGMDWTNMVMNAQGVILNEDPAHVLDFHNAALSLFYKIYQAQDSSMLTIDNLVSTATDVGIAADVSAKFADAYADGTYNDWVDLGTKTFNDKGYPGTPTILLDGKTIDLSTISTATALTDLVG